MKRAAVLIISGGVLIAATAWLFSHASVQWKALDFWELQTGQYVVEHDTLNGVDRRIPATRDLLEQSSLIGKKARESALANFEYRNRQKWEADLKRINVDAWVAEAKGYLVIKGVDCAAWESCKKESVASFFVAETESQELPRYFGNSPGLPVVIMLGCDDGSKFRFITFENMKSLAYDEFSGDGLEKLRKSSPEHPVMIRVEKPLRSYGDPATEGLTCMTPFSKYEVIE